MPRRLCISSAAPVASLRIALCKARCGFYVVDSAGERSIGVVIRECIVMAEATRLCDRRAESAHPTCGWLPSILLQFSVRSRVILPILLELIRQSAYTPEQKHC